MRSKITLILGVAYQIYRLVTTMGKCRLCGREGATISNVVGVCADCLRNREDALKIALEPHERYRKVVSLPIRPPRSEGGIKCGLCVNECVIGEGERGFCGFWRVRNGALEPVVGRGNAAVLWYLDPHPTNCVAGPVCPANTSRGYPKYTHSEGIERGYSNLAVFFAACSLDCVFCQNWEHKEIISREPVRKKYIRSVDELVSAAKNPKVTCVCYFGGDPGPHAPYAIEASRRIAKLAEEKGVIKRICWETNGLENTSVMLEMCMLSLITGGIVKIDWKAWTPSIYEALTGVEGHSAVERLKKNVKAVARYMDERIEPPLLVVSTLLVPGYVDVEEVRNIAEFLASINPRIPYVLLAFHPDHLLTDLPPTSTSHALDALQAAKKAGLEEVYLGNTWLLGNYY